MASRYQNLVEYSSTKSPGKGVSNSSNLQNLFPGSPIYQGNVTDEERLELFLDLRSDGSKLGSDDMTYLAGYYSLNKGVSMEYTNHPDFPDPNAVQTGGGGLPASAYTPNPSSPGPGSTKPIDMPALPAESLPQQSNLFGSGVPHHLNPKFTTENIQKQEVGNLESNRSFPGSGGS